MASPVVEEAIETATATANANHTVTLPTATAGQLLLIILDKGTPASTATINAHSELTELLDENIASGLYIAYRWMDGAEPASYTLVSSVAIRTARIAYRISGAENPATQAPEIAAATATGSSATPDPPASVTPASSKDYLFVAFYGAAGEEADDDTWSDTPPTNYTPSPPRQIACGVAGTNLGGLLAAAERQLTTGAAENPGTFAKDVSAAWRAQTIMVHPATAGPQQDLTGVLFTKAPTFPTGTITTTYALTGALFTKAPTFPTGAVSQPGGADPPNLQVTIVGTTAQLTWTASVPAPTDYSVFRRSPPTGVPFDPVLATPIATGVTATSYDDTSLPVGEYEWQVFGRTVT